MIPGTTYSVRKCAWCLIGLKWTVAVVLTGLPSRSMDEDHNLGFHSHQGINRGEISPAMERGGGGKGTGDVPLDPLLIKVMHEQSWPLRHLQPHHKQLRLNASPVTFTACICIPNTE